MHISRRYPISVPGKFYITEECLDCDLCRELMPDNIRRDNQFGYSYFFKQPQTSKELKLAKDSVEDCPMEAIREDGDQYDWAKEPIMDWPAHFKRSKMKLKVEMLVPVIPYDKEKA